MPKVKTQSDTVARQAKVKDLDGLAALLEAHQRNGQKVVLCHGVFDLLHIGHIRHFEEAKRYGDVLVVTLTEDQHVNKGPNRPAFAQGLRAEAIAALECVDYVSFSKWPMAMELIKTLRPDFYVKGSDYAQAEKDVTGGITLERDAVESVGGKLVFTDDITFSSSNLLNQFFPAASEEVTGYLDRIRSKYSLDEILAYLDRMKPLKVLAVGEAIIDEYRYVQAIGKSSKEPTLAVKHLSTEKFAGGILACANTAAEFSDNVGLLTLVGDNDREDAFIETELKSTIVHHLIKRADSPTIKKTRFVESNNLSKLFEVYTISDDELRPEDNEALCRKLEQMVPHYDMVVLVDFGHSMLTERAVGIICDQARFLCVNAQSNAGNLGYQSIRKFRRADYVCMTENEARLEARSRSGNLKVIVEKLARQMGCKSMVVTRGKSGSVSHSPTDGFSSAPSLGGRVVDRVGAGDAFLAVTGMAALLGAPTDVLEFIGNAVGALAVATVGHREPISKVKLTKFITSLLK